MNKNQALPWEHPRFRSWIAVGRACQLMQQVLARELARLDIKPPHLDILVNLYRFDELTQQDLARKLLVGRSNMSMLLPQMEKRGLVRRSGDSRDKRVLRLSLTGEGRVLAEEAMRIQTDVIERTLAHTELDRCHELADIMEGVTGVLLAEIRDGE